MNRDYIDWLESLPINRGQRKSWVGVYSVEEEFEPFHEWQQRISTQEAPRGVISRWTAWFNS